MKHFNHILTGLIIASASLILTNDALGQSVGIGSSTFTPDVNSVLEIQSTTKGVLMPRATSNPTVAGGNDDGLIYFNTTSNEYRYYDESVPEWKTLLGVGAVTPYIKNQYLSAQTTPSEFWIDGRGRVDGTMIVGSDLTVGNTAAGTGNITLSDDGAWIGRGAALPRIEFTASLATESIKVYPTNQVNVLINKLSDPTSGSQNTAFTIENAGASNGVGLKLSGNRGSVPDALPTANTREIGFIDFENTYGTTATFARIGVTNPSTTDLNMFHISLWSGAALVERLALSQTGNLRITGKFTSQGIQETSDGRFKKNITGISNALSTVLKLEGVTYNWRSDEFPERAFGEQMEYGVIAQQIEKFVPELVSTDENGFKSVQYSHMVPLLLEAIKEQQDIINSQSKELGVLKASVEAISEYIKTAEK